MADTGGERITDTSRFKHHAIPVPEITATDRIIDTTTGLTAAIAGVQDAPPNKMEAIQSLCTLLLGKVTPLPLPTPSILPTPSPPTPVVGEDEPVIIWNPQLVQPALPTHNLNTDNINSNRNTPAIVKDNDGNNNSPILSQRTRPPCQHLIRPLQNHPLTRNRLRLRSAHMINCVIVEELMPTPALLTRPPSLHQGHAFAAECILLETISPPSHSTIHFISAIINDNTGDVLEYRHLMKIDKHKKMWAHGLANEIGQLFQGIRNVPAGTDTCFFIPKSLVPAHKRPTYGRICCNYQQQKEEKHHVRLTVGGNWIDYPGNKSTPMTDLTTAKLLINSTISTPGAKFLGIDLANFYLNTPMPNPEYMRLRFDIIPKKIIDHYNLRDIVTPDGWVYIEIWKGMYGLP
jgi:hypothetical protein